nr:WbqC family protein [uncultured Dongia sp.]
MKADMQEAPVKSGKTALITQSNYIPWKGYFDLIASVDELILLDSVQYTRRDWRNRNIIKTPSGPLWLTIPVKVKGRYQEAIDEIRIADTSWVDTHIRSISLNYKRAAGFQNISPWLFDSLAAAANKESLSEVNESLIRSICSQLGIATPIRRCTDVLDRASMQKMEPTERLLELCHSVGAKRYVSGPAAKQYLDVARFDQLGIDVEWADYGGYPEYPQLWGSFDHYVSIVDLLLNAGHDAGKFMKYM